MFQNMANLLKCDKGSQLLIQIHTVNKIAKQQWEPFTVTGFPFLYTHVWRKRNEMKNIVQCMMLNQNLIKINYEYMYKNYNEQKRKSR